MVDTQLVIEYASTDYIEFLLASPPLPTTVTLENFNNIVIIISSTMKMKLEAVLVACSLA